MALLHQIKVKLAGAPDIVHQDKFDAVVHLYISLLRFPSLQQTQLSGNYTFQPLYPLTMCPSSLMSASTYT